MIDSASRIRRAIRLNDLTLLRRIIRNNAHSIQSPDEGDDGNTSLHLAAKLGLSDIAEFLISAGHEASDISRNANQETPLHLAVANAHEAAATLLAGRFPNCIPYKDQDGVDAIMLAARMTPSTTTATNTTTSRPTSSANPVTPIAEPPPPLPSTIQSPSTPLSAPTPTSILQASNTNTNPYFPTFQSPPARETSAFTAPNTNTPDLLPTLLTMHPYPLPLPLEATDNQGNTPLHFASAYGALKSIRTLLELGADADARNVYGWSAEEYAATVAFGVSFKKIVGAFREQVAAAAAAAASAAARSRSGSLAQQANQQGQQSGGSRAKSGSGSGSGARPGPAPTGAAASARSGRSGSGGGGAAGGGGPSTSQERARSRSRPRQGSTGRPGTAAGGGPVEPVPSAAAGPPLGLPMDRGLVGGIRRVSPGTPTTGLPPPPPPPPLPSGASGAPE